MIIREKMKQVLVNELNELGSMYYKVMSQGHIVTVHTMDYEIQFEEGWGEVHVYVEHRATKAKVVSTLFPIGLDEVSWTAMIGLPQEEEEDSKTNC